jgi:hypothetical protein
MSDNGSTFKVSVSKATAQRIRRLHKVAVRFNMGQRFKEALRIFGERLKADPLRVGEPLYRLPSGQALKYLAVAYPVSIEFAVHEQEHVVFVHLVRFLP